jgi:uncharacterized membrane protein
MTYTCSEIIVLFFVYAVIGWLWETIYCSIKDQHLDYRGFLFGPYCPVYGFAVATILLCTQSVQDNLVLLFIVGMIVATLFEYIASLFLEKAFKLKLWDYSDLWGNLQGRVAPVISLFWGAGVVFLVKCVQPTVQKVVNWEEQLTHGWLAVIITVVMGTDTILTMISVFHFHRTTKEVDENFKASLRKLRQRLREATPIERPRLRRQANNIHLLLCDHFEELRPKHEFSWNHRRLLQSFPKLKVVDAKNFNETKHEWLHHRPKL